MSRNFSVDALMAFNNMRRLELRRIRKGKKWADKRRGLRAHIKNTEALIAELVMADKLLP